MSNLSINPKTPGLANDPTKLAQANLGIPSLTDAQLAIVRDAALTKVPTGVAKGVLEVLQSPEGLINAGTDAAKAAFNAAKDLIDGKAPEKMAEFVKVGKQLLENIMYVIEHNPEILASNPLFRPLFIAQAMMKSGKDEDLKKAGEIIGEQAGKWAIPLALSAVGLGLLGAGKKYANLKKLAETLLNVDKSKSGGTVRKRAQEAIKKAREQNHTLDKFGNPIKNAPRELPPGGRPTVLPPDFNKPPGKR
jgi:hypothetical protein